MICSLGGLIIGSMSLYDSFSWSNSFDRFKNEAQQIEGTIKYKYSSKNYRVITKSVKVEYRNPEMNQLRTDIVEIPGLLWNDLYILQKVKILYNRNLNSIRLLEENDLTYLPPFKRKSFAITLTVCSLLYATGYILLRKRKNANNT